MPCHCKWSRCQACPINTDTHSSAQDEETLTTDTKPFNAKFWTRKPFNKMQNLLWSSKRGLQIPSGNKGNVKCGNVRTVRKETPNRKCTKKRTNHSSSKKWYVLRQFFQFLQLSTYAMIWTVQNNVPGRITLLFFGFNTGLNLACIA